QALQGRGRFQRPGRGRALERGLRRATARHRGAQPRERPRGEAAAHRHEPARLPQALSVSAYSNIAFVRSLGPLMRPDGSFLALTYMAGERVIPGYGGGMSSAKAALEADTRTLAYEAGRRFGVRV